MWIGYTSPKDVRSPYHDHPRDQAARSRALLHINFTHFIVVVVNGTDDTRTVTTRTLIRKDVLCQQSPHERGLDRAEGEGEPEG